MDHQPSGTVAFLFTDIEGSTELWQRHGDRMTAAVTQLDDIVADIVSSNGGTVVHERGEGDGHFLVFDQSSRAVVAAADLLAAVEAERWPDELALRIRAGIHLGEVDSVDGGYYGTSVNQAARLRSLAHGGQAITSRVVRDTASDRLPNAIDLLSLGPHRIRNWPNPTEIFQVCRADLQRDFPPVRSEDLDVPPLAAVVVLDIVGSTAFARGADHDELVSRHRTSSRTLRLLFDSMGGRVFQSIGDGCQAGFDTPQDAIGFASRARSELASTDQPTRIGIDFGPVELLDGELSGHASYVAAELCASAEAGMIIVSPVVHDLVRRLKMSFTARGPIELRSVSEPIQTYRL